MGNGFIIMVNLYSKEFLHNLLKTQEGKVLVLSFCLLLCLGFYLFFSYIFDPKYANKIAGMVFTNIFIGRVPALSFGYAANLSHLNVVGFNVLTEMILVTFLYAVFVFSYKGILKIKALETFFLEVERKKEEHQERLKKYGKWGLFIFVFIPFWMTGPIVGSIIGFLIGMKHYTTMGIVFIATIISMTLWGMFLQEIVDFIVTFDSRLIWILFLMVIMAVLMYKLKKRG